MPSRLDVHPFASERLGENRRVLDISGKKVWLRWSVHRATGEEKVFVRSDDGNHWQVKFQCKGEITLIVGWYCHDGPCAIPHDDIVCDPDWKLPLINWVDGVAAREDPGLVIPISSLPVY